MVFSNQGGWGVSSQPRAVHTCAFASCSREACCDSSATPPSTMFALALPPAPTADATTLKPALRRAEGADFRADRLCVPCSSEIWSFK
eukprot:1155620-Pelagomonas_calceolata.AAC.18